MQKLIQAIQFATAAHEGQRRKGTNKPYISHPLSVSFILSKALLSNDIVIAGVLHDVIEDCQVKPETISGLFGPQVASTVLHVSNMEPFDTYKLRTTALLHKIHNTYDFDACMVRSADMLSNGWDIIEDSKRDGIAVVFKRFKGTLQEVVDRYSLAIHGLIKRYPRSPLVDDLLHLQYAMWKLAERADPGNSPERV